MTIEIVDQMDKHPRSELFSHLDSKTMNSLSHLADKKQRIEWFSASEDSLRRGQQFLKRADANPASAKVASPEDVKNAHDAKKKASAPEPEAPEGVRKPR